MKTFSPEELFLYSHLVQAHAKKSSLDLSFLVNHLADYFLLSSQTFAYQTQNFQDGELMSFIFSSEKHERDYLLMIMCDPERLGESASQFIEIKGEIPQIKNPQTGFDIRKSEILKDIATQYLVKKLDHFLVKKEDNQKKMKI